MASIQRRGQKWQVRVRHKLLLKPYFGTFDAEQEARTYADQLEALLARGVVPSELTEPTSIEPNPLIVEIIRDYMLKTAITKSDDALLGVMLPEVAGLRLKNFTFLWADTYVRDLKLVKNLAPSSIRKRVGALGRVMDWYWSRNTPKGETITPNPLRLLARGYSNYSKAEGEKAIELNKEVKVDIRRDRRLAPDEEVRVRSALAGEKPPDKERGLVHDPEFTMLYELIVDTGMRLYECYRQRIEGIDLARRIIVVDGSKGHRGSIKRRVVPIKMALAEKLRAYIGTRTSGPLFGFWDGAEESRRNTSSRLSQRFTSLFRVARVPDMTEHDLRHEATCRWIELRNDRGWVFSDTEICRIMGWSSTAMLLRYASLRGEDLAARLT